MLAVCSAVGFTMVGCPYRNAAIALPFRRRTLGCGFCGVGVLLHYQQASLFAVERHRNVQVGGQGIDHEVSIRHMTSGHGPKDGPKDRSKREADQAGMTSARNAARPSTIGGAISWPTPGKTRRLVLTPLLFSKASVFTAISGTTPSSASPCSCKKRTAWFSGGTCSAYFNNQPEQTTAAGGGRFAASE